MLNFKYISYEDIDLIKDFECEDEPSVKDFLIKQALDHQNMSIASTRLYFDDDKNLVGYFTVYNDMMQIGKKKRRKHNMSHLPSFKYYPALKLHYLGVDSRFRKMNYGKYLLTAVLNLAKTISRDSGCVFLSLESLPSSVEFYKKYEFQYLSNNRPFTNMFFKIDELNH